MTGQFADSRSGLAQALLAALLWGVMPVYFKLLQSVPALEVVAHRILWSVPLLLVILWVRKNLSGLRTCLTDSRNLGFLFLTAVLIAVNWLLYVWAVQEDHILGASLGYFISPLLSVVFGWIFLRESLSRNQWIAVGIAAIGVSILAFEAWQTLWISMVLAGSWSLYSLLRKITPAGPIVGLTIETGILFPVFLAFILWLAFADPVETGGVHFGKSLFVDLLLIGGAFMTAAPLMLFAAAIKKMRLSTTGLLLYVAPTIQFLIGVFIYDEPMTTSHVICFLLIWASLAIFSTDAYLGSEDSRASAA